MSYFSEVRRHRRPLLGATFGLATGSSTLTLFTTSIVAPQMLGEFGWTRASFALLGVLSLVPSLCFPVVGRMADLFGVKRTALVGIVITPIAFLAYSMMTGQQWQYIAIYLAMGIFSITTTNTVYSRIAVQYVENARGLALAIVASGTAITGAIDGPIFNGIAEEHGWRFTYQALAAFAAVSGVITLLLLPKEKPAARAVQAPKRRASKDYPTIFRAPAFWLLLAATLLCNLPLIVITSQLKMVLVENGIASNGTSVMLAALPVGLFLGRMLAGVALDRFSPYLIGFIGTALPSVGLFLFASSIDAPAALTFAVLCLGFAVGAEGDILAFIVARQFGVDLYSSVMGLITMAMSLSVSLGAALLSLTLTITSTFDAFMLICGTAVICGSLLFLFLRRQNPTPQPA